MACRAAHGAWGMGHGTTLAASPPSAAVALCRWVYVNTSSLTREGLHCLLFFTAITAKRHDNASPQAPKYRICRAEMVSASVQLFVRIHAVLHVR